MPGFSVQLYAVDFQDKCARNIRDLEDEDNSLRLGSGGRGICRVLYDLQTYVRSCC